MFLSIYKIDITNTEMMRLLFNAGELHKFLLKGFQADRQTCGLLYTVQDQLMYIKSDIRPPEFPHMKQLCVTEAMNVQNEKIYEFRTEVLPRYSDHGHKRPYTGENARDLRLGWLKARLEKSGCTVLSAREVETKQKRFTHSEDKGGAVTLSSYVYTGRIKVNNAEDFLSLCRRGLGGGKNYGNGMILLAA